MYTHSVIPRYIHSIHIEYTQKAHKHGWMDGWIDGQTDRQMHITL